MASPPDVPADHPRDSPFRRRRPLAGTTAVDRRAVNPHPVVARDGGPGRREDSRRQRAYAAPCAEREKSGSRLLGDRHARDLRNDDWTRGDIEDAACGRRSRCSTSKCLPRLSRTGSPAQAGRRELFAVNVDTHESDLETVDEKTLRSTTLAGIPFVRHSEWSESPRDLADAATARSGLASWLLVAVLALLLVEPLLAWSFRHGFILLCTLALCGLAAPWVPRNAWGGLIIAVLLAGGVVAVLLFGQERRSTRISLETARRSTAPWRLWPFVRSSPNRLPREPQPRQTSPGGVD